MQDSSPPQTTMRSPFHGFLPFFWLAITAISGIVLSDWISLPAWTWLVAALVPLAALILAWRLPLKIVWTHHLRDWAGYGNRLPAAILLAIGCIGAWRFASSHVEITPQHLAYYNDRGVLQLTGRVIQPPDDRDHTTHLVLDVESLRLFDSSHGPTPGEKITGRLLLQVPPGSAWEYGTRLRVTGVLNTPPEYADFPYQVFLARRGILSIMPYARVDWAVPPERHSIQSRIFQLRAEANTTLYTIFPSPEADLLAGILLGLEQGLSPNLQEAFRRTGTTHIIAISGFNIAIVAGLFAGISTRLLGRKWGAITAIAGITGYAILVGGDAAVVRAAVMGGLGILGGMFGRRQNGLNSLGVAAFVMVMINPNLPWDIGFQLSIAATLGLILYAQPLEEHFIHFSQRWLTEQQAQKIAGPVSEMLLFTLAAQVMTIPIMAYHFGGISWVALAANPLILPVQSLVIILGGLAVVAGLLLPGMGHVLGMLALPFIRYTIRVVSWMGYLPAADLLLPRFHVSWLVIFYALLIVITLLPSEQRSTLGKKVFTYQTGLLVLSGAVIFLWNNVLSRPDEYLHLTLLDDVGSVLVQSPSGNSVLIGGGPRASHLSQCLGEMLPGGRRNLNLLIIGSTYRDDLNALTGVLNTYKVETALWSVDLRTNQSTETVYALLASGGVPITPMEPGQVITLDNGVYITVLWVGARGAVLWLEWDQFTALLPTGRVDQNWLESSHTPTLLLLPGKASDMSFILEQLNRRPPAVILLPMPASEISLVGEHPLLTLLSDYPLVSTHNAGWVRVSTDSEQIWISTQHPIPNN